jgi:hypothetical protein
VRVSEYRVSRRETLSELPVGLLVGLLIVALAAIFTEAWIVMLALGALAAVTGWACALGYWATFLILLIVSFITGIVKS